jgi:predicted  nucleic acid-binding Zn-ribbon protein
MARDPQFEQQLNDAKKLLKQLNDIRMQLGRDPIKLTDPESVKQLKSLPSDIRDARKALDEMNGSASNLYSRLKAVTSEFKNQTSETANIRKGFRALTSIVEDLKFEEAGISDLNTKQLNNLVKA